MEDAKQDPSLDDESWMNEMGWGEDTTAEAVSYTHLTLPTIYSV